MYKIYSKDNCAFCINAKMLLDVKNIPYVELKLDRDFTRDELLAKFPMARTYPQIETNTGEYVGGYDQLEKRIQ